jgi:hypothetical protein
VKRRAALQQASLAGAVNNTVAKRAAGIVEQTAPCCGNCKFSAPISERMQIACRRYPAIMEKAVGDWCGEFAERQSK